MSTAEDDMLLAQLTEDEIAELNEIIDPDVRNNYSCTETLRLYSQSVQCSIYYHMYCICIALGFRIIILPYLVCIIIYVNIFTTCSLVTIIIKNTRYNTNYE